MRLPIHDLPCRREISLTCAEGYALSYLLQTVGREFRVSENARTLIAGLNRNELLPKAVCPQVWVRKGLRCSHTGEDMQGEGIDARSEDLKT